MIPVAALTLAEWGIRWLAGKRSIESHALLIGVDLLAQRITRRRLLPWPGQVRAGHLPCGGVLAKRAGAAFSSPRTR